MRPEPGRRSAFPGSLACDVNYLDGYQLLAHAIVAQAARDYRAALRARRPFEAASLERFFRSGVYAALTDADGEGVMRLARQAADMDSQR